jgi:cell division protein FtsX
MSRPEILTKYPKVEINGIEREMLPLNTPLVFDFAELAQEALFAGSQKTLQVLRNLLSDPKSDDEKAENEKIAGVLTIVTGAIHSREKVFKFLGSLIGITADDFKALPASAIIKVVKGALQHPDLTDFFAEAQSLMQNDLVKKLRTDSTTQ